MGRKRGCIIAVIGWVLSPLSWYNDPVVNIPLSYAVACLVALFNESLFLPAFVAAYLASNILGLVLLHLGAEEAIKGEAVLTRDKLLKSIVVSAVYTALVVTLFYLGIVKPVWEYIPR